MISVATKEKTGIEEERRESEYKERKLGEKKQLLLEKR